MSEPKSRIIVNKEKLKSEGYVFFDTRVYNPKPEQRGLEVKDSKGNLLYKISDRKRVDVRGKSILARKVTFQLDGSISRPPTGTLRTKEISDKGLILEIFEEIRKPKYQNQNEIDISPPYFLSDEKLPELEEILKV